MNTNLQYINQICTDLGGTGGHVTNVAGENEICTLLGGTGGHTLEIDALNEICTLQSVTGSHSLNLEALKSIGAGSFKTNLEAWSYIQSSSVLNLPPAYNLVSLYLDGTILESSGSYYFVDKKAGNNVLINGYDFPAGWAKGFPYKSAATIDIFGQTGVPVISLFQNFDYANQYFTKHVAHVVDENGVETSQAYVSAIVAYSEALTGDNLTAANTYFGVPAEVTTAIRWVSKTGNDAADGSKATPWLTLQKANTSATANDTIYVKSGTYSESHSGVTGYFNWTKALHIKCIGKVEIISPSTTFVMLRSGANSTLDRAIINGEGAKDYLIDALPGTFSTAYSNCLLKGSNLSYNAGSSVNTSTYSGCIFIGNSAKTTQKVTMSGALLSGCYISDVNFDIVNTSITIINNLVKKNTFECFSLKNSAASVVGNTLNYDYYAIHPTAFTSTKLITISNNTFNQNKKTAVLPYSILESGNTVGIDFVITNNNFTALQDVLQGFISIYNFRRIVIDNNNFLSTTKNAVNHIFLDGGVYAEAGYLSVRNNYCKTSSLSSTTITLFSETGTAHNGADGAIITGNTIIGSRNENFTDDSSLHALLINGCKNNIIKYNSVQYCSLGIVVKTGTQQAYTSGGVFYNLVKDCYTAIWVKGVSGLNIFNNTIKHSDTAYHQVRLNQIICDENSAVPGDQFCENIIIKNNIISVNQNLHEIIYFDNHAAENGCIAENNQLYGAKLLKEGTTVYDDLATAQAAGKLLNCVVGDPSLSASLVPATPLTGADLGADYNTGLDTATTWGSATTIPVITTKVQPATWQKGAFIQ